MSMLTLSGQLINIFEKKVASYLNSKYAVGCINGTAALQVALRILEVGKGDEVIVPTLTFIATINSVIYNNAKPIFMDCDDFYNMDVEKTIKFIKMKGIDSVVTLNSVGGNHPLRMKIIKKGLAKNYSNERAENMLQVQYGNSLFKADQTLINFVKTMKDEGYTPFVVSDVHDNPVQIEDNEMFLEKLISAYASAMNEYIISHEKLKKARNIKRLVEWE